MAHISRPRIAPLLAIAAAVSAGSADAFSGGITGRSGNPDVGGGSTCAACHSGGAYNYNLPTLTGPTTVETSASNSYTLNFAKASGIDAVRAGFNLSATAGTLVDPSGDNSVRKIGSEVTHGTPQVPASGNFAWDFSWTAPASAGTYTFYACTNPVNLNGSTSGDGTVRCSSFELSVNAVSGPPSASDDSYSTSQDTVLNVSAPGVLENDVDADGDPIAAVLEADASSGTLNLQADGSFTYTPDGGFNGTDSFTYRANDGVNNSNVATVTIMVGIQNSAPVASDNAYGTSQGTPLNVPAPGVLGNDTDADGQMLTAWLVDGPIAGAVNLNTDGSFTYTPNAGFTGTDHFTYQANDGEDNSNVAAATIEVTSAGGGGNDGPYGDGGAGGGGGGGYGGGSSPAPALLILFIAAALGRRWPPL